MLSEVSKQIDDLKKSFGVTKNKNYYLLLLHQKAKFTIFFSAPFLPFFRPPFLKWWPKVTIFEVLKRRNPRRSCSTRVFCTQSRGRTGTGVNLLVFETSASTDSAIWACSTIVVCGAKVRIIFWFPTLTSNFYQIFYQFIRRPAPSARCRGVVWGVPSHCRTTLRGRRCRCSQSTPGCRKHPPYPLVGTSRHSS